MPRTQVHSEGPPLSSSGWFRAVVTTDIMGLLFLLGWGSWVEATDALGTRGFGWGTVAYAVVAMPVGLRCFGLWAGALVWRRRLSLIPVVAVLVRGSPLAHVQVQIGVVLYTTCLWIAMLVEGKRIALAVAEATGEEIYEVDPARRAD